MEINDMPISDECKEYLRLSGFTTVDEIVRVVDRTIAGGEASGKWFTRCWDEILDALQVLSVWVPPKRNTSPEK